MKRAFVGLLCALLLIFCACGQTEPPQESFGVAIHDFSESDIRIVEEEFGINISYPLSLFSLSYADIEVPRGRRVTLSIRLEGISVEDFDGYPQLYEYLFGDRYLDGYAVNTYGNSIWAEDISQSDKAIRLEKHSFSTPECKALLGLDN